MIIAIFIIKRKITKKKKFNIISIFRYLKYLKLFLNKKTIFIIIIISILSNSIMLYEKYRYSNIYEEKEYTVIGKIISNKKEKEYKNCYKIKVLKVQNLSKNVKNTYLNLFVDKKINLEYGDIIKCKGIFQKGEKARNYGGFNYNSYLKTQKIYGIFNSKKVEKISKDIDIFSIANNISNRVEEKIDLLLNETEANLCKGLILGKTQEIEESIKENFRIVNISHILAISGLHVTYIVMLITIISQRLIGKKYGTVFLIVVLIFYMFLVGFTPSIVRACIMGILVNLAFLVHKKNNFWNSLALSLLLILINNPYSILNIGLQLSYLATIGIVSFSRKIRKKIDNFKFLKNNLVIRKNNKIQTLVNKIKDNLSVMFSAQILILPIMIYNFNIIGTYFIISNLLVSVIIGTTIFLSILLVTSSFIFFPISKILSHILTILLQLLIIISNISKLPFSKIYIPTPSILSIILYYVMIYVLNFLDNVYSKESDSYYRIRNLIAIFKYRIRKNRLRVKKVIIATFVLMIIINIIPKNLKVHFIDVGQGDSTFIVTPHNKTILIDGGGSLNKNFDVGEKTLVPYILDRGYTKIDYIFVSHFDFDHVGGILSILEELKVGKIIIGKQFENSENYEKMIKIARKKKVEIIQVDKENDIVIDEVKFNIIWPDKENIIKENSLNNNSLVMKMIYKNFSMLFTGDIEEIAERKIIDTYKDNSDILKSDVLKTAHHGSKTSSINEFLKLVKPKIALIGVGKTNTFGHPNIYKDNSDILKSDVLKTAHHGSKTSSINEFLKLVKPKIALIGVGKTNTFGHPNIEVLERLERNWK